jgi:hypothetical protein
MRTQRPVRFGLSTWALVILVAVCPPGCGGSAAVPTTPTTPSAPTLVSLAIAGTAGVAAGSAPIPLTATARYSDGSEQNVTARVTWTSSAGDVATVSAAGILEARAAGDTTVSATLASVSASFSVHVTPRLADVRSRVVESYGGNPIPNAVVTIADGPAAGQQATTDSTGTFVLAGLASATFNMTATAPDFEVDRVRVINGVIEPIRLEPLMSELKWQGTYWITREFVDDRMLTVRHAGPIRGVLHSDCPAGDHDWGPLILIVSDKPFPADGGVPPGTRFLIRVQTDRDTNDTEQTTVVPAGTYYLRSVLDNYAAPTGCGWRMELSYPR